MRAFFAGQDRLAVCTAFDIGRTVGSPVGKTAQGRGRPTIYRDGSFTFYGLPGLRNGGQKTESARKQQGEMKLNLEH